MSCTLPDVVHEPRHFILRMDLLAHRGVEQERLSPGQLHDRQPGGSARHRKMRLCSLTMASQLNVFIGMVVQMILPLSWHRSTLFIRLILWLA